MNMKTSVTMNQKEVMQLAKIASLQTMASMREQISDVIRYELPKVVPHIDIIESTSSTRSTRRSFGRGRMEPPSPPASNYTKVIMASAEWRHGRGDVLGSVWMHKSSTQEKLLVEQYEQECSVLKMDRNQKKAKFDSANQLIEPGMSVWTQFAAVKGVLEDVVANLRSKGWEVLQPEKKSQLTLIDVGT